MIKAEDLFDAVMAANDVGATGLKILLVNKIALHRLQVHEIAEELKASGPLVSRTLDKLEEMGLIERLRDQKEDRRRVYVGLTKKGETFIKNVLNS